jgi:hypothetical protein
MVQKMLQEEAWPATEVEHVAAQPYTSAFQVGKQEFSQHSVVVLRLIPWR